MPSTLALEAPAEPSAASPVVLAHLGVGPDGAALLVQEPSGPPWEQRSLHAARWSAARLAALRERLAVAAMLEHPCVRRAELRPDEAPCVRLAWPEGAVALEEKLLGLSRAQALRLCEALAVVLERAHALGLWHGDLGPQTVLLDAEGEPSVEFSGVRTLGAALLSEAQLACRPPERDAEPVDATTDAFALAALAVCLLRHRAPTREDLAQPPEGLPAGAWTVLRDALAADRDARPTMGDLRVCLSHAARDASTRDLDALQRTAVAAEGAPSEGSSALAPGARLGRFRVASLLGEGGMGQVYEGVDEATGQRVALKVLRPELSRDGVLFKRFRKEARLLGAARSPFVANLLEVSEEGATHFLALEFVPGGSVEQHLQEHRKLEEREALELVVDACRALAEPHRRGIVHRDVKPDNMMFAHADRLRGADGVRVKLCDFGIARTGEKEEAGPGTVALTREGAVLGTPLFMAPEQCAGKPVSAATDVYSLGVTLFNLLTGRTPFEGEEPMQLLVQHLNAQPPALRSLAPECSEAVERLVERALRKDPADRPADAGELRDALERLLGGEPTDVAVHPALPAADPRKLFQREYTWELPATPEQLWPLLGNQDVVGRWMGLPPADVEWVPDAKQPGVLRKLVSAPAGPQRMVWYEQPQEWIEGRSMAFYRVFEKGPMKWLSFGVELAALGERRTQLRFRWKVLPNTSLDRWITRLLVDVVQRRGIARALERLRAHYLSRPAEPALAPLTEPERLPRETLERIEQLETALLTRGLDARAVRALAEHVRTAHKLEVSQLRPLAFARAHRLDTERAVEVFLHAASQGLLALGWDVLCPTCKVSAGGVDSLRALGEHARCETCAADFRNDFAASVELVFRASPSLRESERQTYCTNGPQVSPHVVAQVRLAPGERLALPLRLSPGAYRVRSPQVSTLLDLRAGVALGVGRVELDLGPAAQSELDLAPGPTVFVLRNTLDRELVVRVERRAPRGDALTAAKVTAMPLFRELFPSQILAPGRLVAVSDRTMLVATVEGGEALYGTLGDARAFELVYGRMQSASAAVERHGGTVLKLVDASLLADFERCADALACATELAADPATPGTGVALHSGPMLAATVNDRVDLFGQHAVLARRVGALTRGHRVALSPAVAQDPAAQEALRGAHAEARVVPPETGVPWVLEFAPPAKTRSQP